VAQKGRKDDHAIEAASVKQRAEDRLEDTPVSAILVVFKCHLRRKGLEKGDEN